MKSSEQTTRIRRRRFFSAFDEENLSVRKTQTKAATVPKDCQTAHGKTQRVPERTRIRRGTAAISVPGRDPIFFFPFARTLISTVFPFRDLATSQSRTKVKSVERSEETVVRHSYSRA